MDKVIRDNKINSEIKRLSLCFVMGFLDLSLFFMWLRVYLRLEYIFQSLSGNLKRWVANKDYHSVIVKCPNGNRWLMSWEEEDGEEYQMTIN